MGNKLKTTCLAITAAAFVMMIVSLIFDGISSNQRLSDYMTGNMWMIVLPSAVSLACALIYILKGGTKKVAFFYKGFLALYIVSHIVFIISTLVGSYSVISPDAKPIRMIILFLAWIIEYSVLLFLAFAPNLGKHISLLLALVAVIMNICIVAMFFKLGFSISILLRNISRILMIVLLYLLVIAKYIDKEKRGTK